MAELYQNNPENYHIDNSNGYSVPKYTGDKATDMQLNGLSDEDRKKYLEEANAPLTGEDVAKLVQSARETGYEPTAEEVQLYKGWAAKQNHSILQGIAEGFAGVKKTFLDAGQEFIDHPFDTTVKLPTSVAEGFFQGGRNLYGMLAESQDPNSALFRFKNILTGDGSDPESERRQFIEAMKFNHHSMDLEEGKDTLVLDKDIINHKVATAASFIADPTLLIPYVGEATGLAKAASAGMRAIGVGERIAKITARSAEFQNKILGGALKWGVGTPVEFMGGAVRNTIDYGTMQSGRLVEAATGLPMSDWRATVRMSQLGTLGAEALGASIPVAGDISKAHLAGTFGQGFGSAISAVGDQMIKQAEFGRGVNSYAKQALLDAEKNGIVLTQHTKNMLRVLDAVDPLFSYSRVMAEGAVHGAAIGGTLGALSGGEEGFAQGVGAGIGLGMVGAGGARLYGDIGSGTHNARVDIQSKLTLEGWKQVAPEKSFFWGLVKAHAEATGDAAYLNKVNGYIAGIDKVCPDLQLHSFVDGKSFNGWLIENGYNPETKHFIETTALMEKAGLTREEQGKVLSVLRDNGNKFAGDSKAFQEHMAGAGKDLKYKGTYDSLSQNAKDALHQTIDNHAELIKQLKGEGDTIKDYYGDHAAAQKFVDNINQFHKNSPTDAIRKAREILDSHRDENGNLTRRGEYIKDKLRADGYTDAEGNVLPQRNMAVADLSGAEFNAAAGFVCRREQDGKVHMYLNLENVTRKTIPHEVFHAIFRESPMKKEFMSRWMRELLGSKDAQGNVLQKPSVDIEQVRKFFHRYADIDPMVIDKQAKKDAINKAIEEHQKSGTNNTIADGTQSSLEKYAEEFGAYYYSHWLDSKPTDYLFHGGELTGMRGLMERVKEGWTGYWKEKMGNANPDFNFDRKGTLESQFEKNGKRIEVDAFDLFMRDFTRATANSNRGAFDPRSMSPRALGDFAESNGIYNVSTRDGQGRTIAINENQYNKLNAIAGREIFKVLNGLDPKLRTTQTITIDGKQFIKGRFSQAELDAIVKSGHRNRAWADKHQQLYAVLDGKGSNVIDFGYLGRTAQIGDYSWPRLTGKQVPFKNRRAILLGMDSHIGQDGSFHTVFHTLDKAVIDARGNDVWKNPEARKLWNGDRAAMESDFFDYLANASLPKDHPDRKPSARLLEKMDGQGTPDGLGSQRRDWLHQMLGFAKEDRDVYINRPIAEIPFGIRHSVTSFNIDGATTFRVENGSRWNVNMDNAHNDLSRNFSPRDMEVEPTPNGQIVKHKTGYRILENQRGNYNLISPTGEFISQHSTVADAGRSAQKHYNATFDKSVEGKDLPVPRTEIPPSRQAYIDREFGGITDNIAGGKEKFLENLSVLIDRITASGDILIGKENRDSALRIKKSIEERGNVTLSELKEIQRIEGINRVHDTSRLPYYNYDYFLETIDTALSRNFDRLGQQYDKMYPMEIKSALHGRLSQIFQDYPNITAQGLLKKLETYGSTGYRYLQEARDIGLVDLLKKKIQPRTEVYRKLDAQGNPTGEVVQRELPVKFKQIAVEVKGEDGKPILDKDGYPVKKLVETNKVVSGTQPILDMKEILDFAKSKEVRVTIEEGAREIHGMNTEQLTLGGDKSNYKETAIRINKEYAHGISGHYGKDVIVHFRTTERLDAEGNRVLFVEEVQANNTANKTSLDQREIRRIPEFEKAIDSLNKIIEEGKKRGRITDIDEDGFSTEDRIANGIPPEEADVLNSQFDNFIKYIEEATKERELDGILGTKRIFIDGGSSTLGEILDGHLDVIISSTMKKAQLNQFTDLKSYKGNIRIELGHLLDGILSDKDQRNIKTIVDDITLNYDINKLIESSYKEAIDQREWRLWLEKSHLENYYGVSSYSRNPQFFLEAKSDIETRVQQAKAMTGDIVHPLTEIKDWSLTAVKGIIRQAIRDGHDTITLTHPDDSPTVSHMEENARRKDYGEIFPAVWGSWLKKYGIKIERQNKLANPSIEALRNNLVEVQNKIPEANKKVMDRFQQVMAGEDPTEIKKVSELLSLPVHEADGRIADRIKIAALGINDVELKGLVEEVGLLKGAEKDAYKKIEQLRENGISSQPVTTEDINNGTRGFGKMAISAEAIDRGMTFKLNDAIKRDFLEGNVQIYAQPAEEGSSVSGGRKYDLNSPEFRTGFIGKVASTNQNLIKDKNIEFVKRKDGSYRITMTDNSGQTQKVGHITATIDDSSMVAGEGAAEISSNIDPKFRGQKLANVLYSEMAERLRAMGVKYVDGTIVNKDGIPVQVRNTVIGQTYYKGSNRPAFREDAAKRIQAVQSVSPTKGIGVYNELDKNGHYQPTEGGRTYTPEQFDKEFIGKFAEENPDIANKFLIRIKENDGGTMDDYDYKMLVYDKETKKLVARTKWQLFENDDGVMEDAAADVEIIDPAYKGMKLSHLMQSERLERSRFLGAEKVRSQITNQEGIPIKNYSKTIGEQNGEVTSAFTERVDSSGEKMGWLPATMENFQGEMELSKAYDDGVWKPVVFYRANLDTNAHYSPSEGGRTYTPKQMAEEFIGRVAGENKSITKGIRLDFRKINSSRFGDEYRIKLYKDVGNNDEVLIGTFNSEIDGKSAWSGTSEIKGEYQNKGYGRLMYSEMAERLRALGAEEWSGRMIDQARRPQTLRERVIDKENRRLGYQDAETTLSDERQDYNGDKTFFIHSELKKEAHYSVAEKEDALIQNGFEKSELNKKLIKSGHIVLNFDQRELSGKAVVINQPDTMMTGTVETKSGKVLAEGEGGLNFVSKFADVWANSKEAKARTTANNLRKAQKENGGVAYLGLTRGDLTKPLTSHTGAKAGMAILEHFVDEGYISLDEFRNALKDSGRKYGIDFNATKSAKDIHAEIANKFFGVSDSTFKKRGFFVTDVINHLSKNGQSGHINIQKIRDALGSERLGRNIAFKAKGIKEAIGLMISDKRANVDPSHIYAYIEVTGNISVEQVENGHKSYPWHIVQRDDAGNKIRPRMLIPDKTNYVTDVMLDKNKEPVPRTYQVKDKKGKIQTKSGADKLGSNTVGEAFGFVKPAKDIPEGKPRLAWQPAEGVTDWKSERTTAGSILTNTAGYVISNINGKYKVYNPYKAMIGIYDNQDTAKKRVLKEASKQ